MPVLYNSSRPTDLLTGATSVCLEDWSIYSLCKAQLSNFVHIDTDDNIIYGVLLLSVPLHIYAYESIFVLH